MMLWQKELLLIFLIIALVSFFIGLYQSIKKKNSFQETPYLSWLGIFVWGDAVIIGFFWFLVSFFTLLIKDWLLFLIIVSIFWTIRSLGETHYWLNQQFSPLKRNPPERLRGYKFFKNDSIWFVYQIFWQCLGVVFVIISLYLAKLWLK